MHSPSGPQRRPLRQGTSPQASPAPGRGADGVNSGQIRVSAGATTHASSKGRKALAQASASCGWTSSNPASTTGRNPSTQRAQSRSARARQSLGNPGAWSQPHPWTASQNRPANFGHHSSMTCARGGLSPWAASVPETESSVSQANTSWSPGAPVSTDASLVAPGWTSSEASPASLWSRKPPPPPPHDTSKPSVRSHIILHPSTVSFIIAASITPTHMRPADARSRSASARSSLPGPRRPDALYGGYVAEKNCPWLSTR